MHGADGTDEVSIAGETFVAELDDGKVREFSVHPEDAGLPPHPLAAILGGAPAENARALRGLLAGEASAYRDAVLLNAAAALVVADRAADLREGVALARDSIDSGAARDKADRLAAVTGRAGGAAMSILDDIRAYKLADVAARKAARPLAEIEAAARAAGRGARLRRGAAPRLGPRLRADRRDQEGEPVQGPDPRRLRPRRARRRLRARRRRLPQRADRRPELPGRRQPPRRSPAPPCALPVLRKDFLFDPWQVAESRALGADCILIILAGVSDAAGRRARGRRRPPGAWTRWSRCTPPTSSSARKLLNSPLVGINNRDLDTFETDLDTTRRLARGVPADRLIVSESGLATRQDLAQLARYGVRCFLSARALMREENVEARHPRAPAQPLDPRGRVMAGLTHFDARGAARMVDVSDKPATARAAPSRAAGSRMAPETLALVAAGGAAKGDVLGVARLAGIMAAKRTAELIPLCHPLALSQGRGRPRARPRRQPRR